MDYKLVLYEISPNLIELCFKKLLHFMFILTGYDNMFYNSYLRN